MHASAGKKTVVVAPHARAIRREGDLAPRKDLALDAAISKTKDVRAQETAGKKPGLMVDAVSTHDLQEQMGEKLDEESRLVEQAIDFETSCEETSKLRFRLADLTWERSKRAFFKANDFKTPEPLRAKFAQEMKELEESALGNYKKIISGCPQYSDYVRVLFNYGRSLTELDRGQDGVVYFKQIITEYPKSELLPQAYFMVGEYYFNTANDVMAALKAYTQATAYPVSPVYAYAVYKQGWCYVNVAEWGQAMQRFMDVVHIAEDHTQPLDDRARISLRKESLKDFVRAYSNVGEAMEAKRHFQGLAKAPEVAAMLESLGNWYSAQGAHGKVVTVYHELVRSYPRSTRIPLFYGRVVDAASRLSNNKETVREVRALTDAFAALRKRVEANDLSEDERKTIDKDLAEAEEVAENTIRRMATEAHKEAKKLRGQGQARAYAFALDLYREYLNVFPEPKPGADVNFTLFMRFYYAQVLYHQDAFLEAAQNYDKVVVMGANPKQPKEKEAVADAAEEAVRSYNELVEDMDRKHPPVIGGTAPKAIPDVKLALIAACQRYIKSVGAAGERIVEIRYKMARIYYTYNHFDAAAPAFDEIVKNHPGSQVACYSANLALDIYNGQKNYSALKAAARAYMDDKALACTDEDRARFAKIEEQSSFHLIKGDLEEPKKYIAAANAYMAFYRSHPQSDLADDAVYNAAVNYDLGNRLDKATEVRQFLVDKLPNSPLVPETLYNMAQSFERIVDFENAAAYLEMFAKRYPQDARSKDAIYNAAAYHATLHAYGAAARNRQDFLRLYPNDPEADRVAMGACESMEKELEAGRHSEAAHTDGPAKTWQTAHDCYFKLIKSARWVHANPDLACEAQFRRLEIMRLRTHYEKGVDEQRRALLRLWPSLKGLKAGSTPLCARAVADIMFRDLAAPTKAYEAMAIAELNPTDKGKKNFDWSVRAKVLSRDRLVQDYQAVAAVGVSEWALAALYQIGAAYDDSIEKLLHAPIPDKIPGYKLTHDDKALLRQKLQEMAQPIQALAVEAYKLCVTKANELGVYNTWSVRALDKLQRLRPEAFPQVEEHLAPVQIAPPLQVQRNSLVIEDGGALKPIVVRWPATHVVPAAAGTAPPPPPVAEAISPAAPAAVVPAADDGIPSPVQE
jgi:TolA-binding protein